MANKELKSIKFEGLDDTYVIPVGISEEEVDTKLSEYAKTSQLDEKLDKGNFSVTGNNITSPIDGKIIAQKATQISSVSGANNSGNTDDFLDLTKYDSFGNYVGSVSTWGQEYTNEQLKEMFQTAYVDFVPDPYNDWEFVSLTENTDNFVGKYRRTGNTSEVANLTYYLSNASSENANKFKSDYALLTFSFYLTEVKSSERKIWNIVNPDLTVSSSSTNAVSGSAVSKALDKKADQSALNSKLDTTALGNFTFDTDTLKDINANAKIILGSDGSQYIPDNLQITSNGISRNNSNDGAVANNWSITDGGSNAPTLTVGSKSETLENIIDAPSKKQDTLVSGTNIKTINGASILGEGDITVTPTIEDTLSDTSTNAVQNKVVKAAIDGKLDKITVGEGIQLYMHAGAVQKDVRADYNIRPSSIPYRDGSSQIEMGTPTKPNHVTTKKYVDDGFTNKLYEANLNWGGKDFASGYGILDAALIPTLGADRFKGIANTDAIIIQYSRDGGTTWLDYGASDKQKIGLFCDEYDSEPINIGKATAGTEITSDYKLRIIIDAYKAKIHTELRKFALYVSTNGSSGCTVTIDAAPADDTTTDAGTNDNYNKVLKQDAPLAGWSGWNVINDFYFTLRNNNKSGHYRKVRFTFSITGQTNTNYVGFRVLCIKAFGGFGWNVPSYEAKYGFPFKSIPSGGYVSDKEFNFVKGLKVNYSPVATESYVTNHLSGKLDKNPTAQQVVYVNDSNSKPSFIKYTPEVTPHTMAYRGANGVLKVGTPTANEDATTKEYVDSKTVTVVDNVTSTSTTAALSANQGKMLKLAIDGKLSSTVVNDDKETDILAGDISVTQINGSSGVSGGIKIDSSVPTLYSGSKSETIENIIDSVAVDITNSELTSAFNVVSTKNWSTSMGSSAGTTAGGEASKAKFFPLIYNQPFNEEAIKSAKILNADTGATIASYTSTEELYSTNKTTAYHFGDNYNIIVVHDQDGDYTQLYEGRIPPYTWANGLCIGVYLCGALSTGSSQEYWIASNIPTTANLTISFPTPLVAPKGYKTLLVGDYLTRYKYTTYDDGKKECEILACVEDPSINSSWGNLYEGSIGSYSFMTGFFTAAPEMSVEIINTQQIENGSEGGVACLMETGFHPTATSTGILYAVRPNNAIVSSSTTKRRIYFKIHAKQV